MLDVSPLTAADAITVLNRTREKLKDVLTHNQFKLFSKATDHVIARIDGSLDRRNELDAQVQAILNSPRFKAERLQREADMVLFRDAMRYVDHVHHGFWEALPDWNKPCIKEPPQGCPDCKDAYDTYMSGIKNTSLEHAYDELARNYDLLNSAHERYMNRIKQRKPSIPIIFKGSGVKEEPE